MSLIEDALKLSLTKREFLKISTMLSLTACTASKGGLFGPSLDELLATGEVQYPDRWKTDDILPLPKEKILIGDNAQVRSSDMRTWRGEGAYQTILANDFKAKFGVESAFGVYGSGKYAFYNDFFNDEVHNSLNEAGIIPVVRYTTRPFKGYKEIIKGKFDDTFKSLADQIAENGVPMVFIPYQSTNEPHSRDYAHGGGSGSSYVEVYIRMHDIFEAAGANKNTIWSTKLRLGSWRHYQYNDPFSFIPPSEYVDWLGWAVNDHVFPQFDMPSLPFDHFLKRTHDKAAARYPDKPQFLWELSTRTGPRQAKWLDYALGAIPKKYHWVRGVVLDVMAFSAPGEDRDFNPELTEEAQEVVKSHVASGAYTGAYTDGSITIPSLRK